MTTTPATPQRPRPKQHRTRQQAQPLPGNGSSRDRGQDQEGGGCAAPHYQEVRCAPVAPGACRAKGTGPFLRPQGCFASPCGRRSCGPPLTSETSTDPGPGKSGQALACPSRSAARRATLTGRGRVWLQDNAAEDTDRNRCSGKQQIAKLRETALRKSPRFRGNPKEQFPLETVKIVNRQPRIAYRKAPPLRPENVPVESEPHLVAGRQNRLPGTGPPHPVTKRRNPLPGQHTLAL